MISTSCVFSLFRRLPFCNHTNRAHNHKTTTEPEVGSRKWFFSRRLKAFSKTNKYKKCKNFHSTGTRTTERAMSFCDRKTIKFEENSDSSHWNLRGVKFNIWFFFYWTHKRFILLIVELWRARMTVCKIFADSNTQVHVVWDMEADDTEYMVNYQN